MKTIYFLAALFILIMGSLSAQTLEEQQKIVSNYDLEALDQLATEFHLEFAAEKQRALDLAAINGWEEFMEMPNEGIANLVGVHENGKPIYYVTHNREGGITTRTNKVHTGGGAGLDLNGENMIIGIWDGGRVYNEHPLLEDRVTQIDNPASNSDHSTHVSGTLIGTGDVIGGAAKGMAPMAELYAYDSNNHNSEMITAAANGLLVSNNSWGYLVSGLDLWQLGYYANSSRNVDVLTYNAPHYLSVWSAGNDRQSGVNTEDGGYDYLNGFQLAKNNLTVAAVYEVLNYTGPNSVFMYIHGNWGPADDGRIKPDISAKGVDMYSSVSVNAYTDYSGTSMAAPNISGSLLLLQQHYNNVNGEYMLASTLKGLALHTADEAGTDPGPDYRFGWGLLNIERAAAVITNNEDSSLIIERELQNGEIYTLSVPSNAIEDLIVSLTWTDAPGLLLPGGPENEDNSTPSLINDLDIRVSQNGGETYYPWKLDPANPSAPATTDDNIVDNMEKVEIAGATGDYLIQISHKGVLTNDSQAFSLIITGINAFLGIENAEIEGLFAYPNPTTNILNIEAASVISTIEVMNVLGQLLYSESTNRNSAQIDLSAFQNGNYFVRVTVDTNTNVLKVIKQ